MLRYQDLESRSPNERFFLIMTKDPHIHRDVWKMSKLTDLVKWSFHSSLYDGTIAKILGEIALRIRDKPIDEQLSFFEENQYLGEATFFLTAQIVGALMKAPVKNFSIIQKLEDEFVTNEQKILLWKNVFDGLHRNRPEKQYALYRLLQLIPFAYTPVIRLTRDTKRQISVFESLHLRIAA